MTTPEDQDPLLNTVLGGARIQRRVSAGLLANVYLGQYERLNVPVAVKVLSPKATAQGVNKERFVREGRALAQLAHPNIIKIYNVGHENGRYFIVMDWIQDGMNLRQLAQSRPLTPGQSLKVLRRLGEALEYIHQKSLIHRDLKPANICLRKGGHPVLMDFSLIKDQSSDVQLTAPGTIMGTVNFMPPEQAQPGGPFGQVGPWSDVYSLGGTLYWLLTGRPPFKGRTPMETIIKLIREPFVPASQINSSIPPEVDAFVAKCLAKKPEERYQSAREFMAAIDELFATCSEALQRCVPPAPASDEDAGGPAPAATAPAPAPAPAQPPSGTGRAWGAGASSGAMPAMPQGAPTARPGTPTAPFPASAPLPAAAVATPPTNGPGALRAPAPVAPAAGLPGPAPRGSTRLAPGTAGSGELAAAPRGTTRLQGSAAQQALAPPPAGAPGGEWRQANGLDVPPDDAATIRIKNAPSPSGRSAAASALAAASAPGAPAPGTPQAAAQAKDLKRSWVEDAAQAPSWTEQEKDPGASTLGMSAPVPNPPSDETSKDEPKTSGRIVAPRPALPARSKRSKLEIVLVVTAIVVIVVCLALAGAVLIFMR